MADPITPPDPRRTARQLNLVIFLMIAVGALLATLVARSRWWLSPAASVQGIEIDSLFYDPRGDGDRCRPQHPTATRVNVTLVRSARANAVPPVSVR